VSRAIADHGAAAEPSIPLSGHSKMFNSFAALVTVHKNGTMQSDNTGINIWYQKRKYYICID
jgi:hypothetical protein